MVSKIQIFREKLLTVQFYEIMHIFQSDRWIKLKYYEFMIVMTNIHNNVCPLCNFVEKQCPV
jgi:hypothetical protein